MLALSNDLQTKERMAAMIEQQGTTKTLPRRARCRRVDRHLIDLRTDCDAASSSRCERAARRSPEGAPESLTVYLHMLAL